MKCVKNLLLFLLLLIVSFLYSEVIEENDYITEIKSFDKPHELISPWIIQSVADNVTMDDTIKNPSYVVTPFSPWQFSVPELANYYGKSLYTLTFKISNEDIINDNGLYIPVSYSGYELFLNKRLIHKTYNLSDLSQKVVIIPNGLLTLGVNEIGIVSSTASGWGGFGGGSQIKIGKYDNLLKNYIIDVIIKISISAICFFLSIYFIFFYMFRRGEKYNIFFSGFCLAVGMFIMGYYGFWYYFFDYPWAYWVLTFIGGINMYLMPILFISSFYGDRLTLFSKILAGFYCFLSMFVIVEYLITGQIFYFNKYLYLGFNFSYIILVVYLNIMSIKAVRKKQMYSKLMLISIILLSVTFVYSMLCFAVIIIKPPLIGEGFFLMAVVYSIVLARRYADTHVMLENSLTVNMELNRTLEVRVAERTKELNDQKQEMEDSIVYASRIQTTMLPFNNVLSKHFSDFFTYWRPKDIVGGDSYWFHETEDGFIYAVLDCTGHGVPGAVLSTTANNMLDTIVTYKNSDDPAKILQELNITFKRILSQENPFDIADDGLDIGLCCYSYSTNVMKYAGSKIRLHYVKPGDAELSEVRGNSQGIGYKRSKANYAYTNHTVPVTQDTMFFMTTDGYLDQHGGQRDFGFGWTRYKDVLFDNRKRSMEEQKNALTIAIKEFQGDNEQRDDITVVGFKIKVRPEAKK